MGVRKYLVTLLARAGLCLLVGLLLTSGLWSGGGAGADDPRSQPWPAGWDPTTFKDPGIQMAPLRPDAWKPLPPRTGFRPPPMDLSHLTGQRMPRGAAPQQLPSAWDWRDYGKVTPVKNQGTCGSCYAFASIGGWESKLLKDGAGTFNLSENHAKECNWRELNNWQYPNPGDYWGSCDGGNGHMMASLFSQTGTVLESCDPYVASDVSCKTTCPYQQTLLDWRLISADVVPDPLVLKQYIYDHGPIIVSMDAEHASFDAYDGSHTLNYAGYTANHCVLIVGWSDSLPPVPGDTAPATGWIVKNSWGTGWGDSGYFYITYGAAIIGVWASFYHEWQDYDPNGDVWYYDDDGWWNGWGYGSPTAWGLAKFIPPSNTNVIRVEFWTTDATTDVDVYLYDDFDGSTPTNLLGSKLNNSYDEAGYHSVALDTPVPVTSGDDVIAVVKFTNESYGYPVAADPHGTIETGRTYLSYSGTSWTDTGATHNTDLAIRLRTSTGVGPSPESMAYLPVVLRNWPSAPVQETFYSTGDACVLQAFPSANFGDTSDMWVGYDHCLDPEGQVARSLVEFDISSIPPGTSISQATLHLYLMNSCDTDDRQHLVTAYRATSSWSESAVTWDNQPSHGEPSGSASVHSRTWGWYVFDVTDLVQGWVDGSFPNYGLMVRGPESSGLDGARLGFATRDEPARKPYLEITHVGAAASEEGAPVATDILKPAACGPTIMDALAAHAGLSAPDGSGFVERNVCMPIDD